MMYHIPKWLLIGICCLTAAGIACGAVIGGVRAVSGMAQSVPIPIIMYHHILEDSRLLGDYVISPGQLESDLDYLQELGYTTVLPSEVEAFVRGEGTLPEKPIMITFDDGNKSNYIYAYPILQERGMKGVISVIGIHSETYSKNGDGNVNYAHATWDELREMADSGVFEIGNHTYNLHEEAAPRRGITRRDEEGLKDYRRVIFDDLSKNQELLFQATGSYPKVFAYPFGFIDKDADAVLDELGFTVTLGVAERVDSVTAGDMDSLKKLGRFNRPYSATTQTFIDRITKQVHTAKQGEHPF